MVSKFFSFREVKGVVWRKKDSISLKKSMSEDFIKYAVEGIQRESGDPDDWDSPFLIKAFLHKINLTTDWKYCSGTYEKLKSRFDSFYIDNSFNPHIRMPNYGKRMIKRMQDFDIYLFTDSSNFAAPSILEIHPSENTSSKQYRELLHSLEEALGILNVSSVEYAIDLCCHDRGSVQRLFRKLTRYIHIPYSREASHYGQGIDLGNEVKMNTVIRMGDVKMYERGADGKKGKSGWNIDDCDRIRLELSASRKIFRKHGIKTVYDLLEDAQFQKINGGIYKFKCFEGSRKLPQCYNAYISSDAKGNKNCLQYEINYFRHTVPNLNQYLKDVKAFDSLKEALSNAMIKFDTEWHN